MWKCVPSSLFAMTPLLAHDAIPCGHQFGTFGVTSWPQLGSIVVKHLVVRRACAQFRSSTNRCAHGACRAIRRICSGHSPVCAHGFDMGCDVGRWRWPSWPPRINISGHAPHRRNVCAIRVQVPVRISREGVRRRDGSTTDVQLCMVRCRW